MYYAISALFFLHNANYRRLGSMEKNLRELFCEAEAAKEEMMETWKFLVNRDCGSGNKAGVDQVGRDIKAVLEPLGFKVRFHEYEKVGNMLVAEYGDMSKPFIVLTGHMDTVFADGTAAKRPFTVVNGRVTGPGCLDMKGGVTILLYAVKFLTGAGYDRYPLKIILAGDEEVGHNQSNAGNDYLAEAKGAVMGFNLETGFMDNGIVVERKGCCRFEWDFQGVGAHAGNNPEDGRSAVQEMCHKAIDMEGLTDFEEGTTVNVGVISGGTVANAVPEHAHCIVDVRFRSEKGLNRIIDSFKKIASRQYIPDTKTTCRLTTRIEAMERLDSSLELFNRANDIAVKNGLPEMKAIAVGGGSDSAYLTKAGIPTLCALGVRGQFNHTEREWAVEDSLIEREKLLLALLMKL